MNTIQTQAFKTTVRCFTIEPTPGCARKWQHSPRVVGNILSHSVGLLRWRRQQRRQQQRRRRQRRWRLHHQQQIDLPRFSFWVKFCIFFALTPDEELIMVSDRVGECVRACIYACVRVTCVHACRYHHACVCIFACVRAKEREMTLLFLSPDVHELIKPLKWILSLVRRFRRN